MHRRERHRFDRVIARRLRGGRFVALRDGRRGDPNTERRGDGKNEAFKVYGNLIERMTMKVFNQYGQLIYESNDLSAGWDGRHKGKLQPIGVYFYAIRLQLKDGSEVTRKGSVNLLH